jgi:hypothetical protein
MPMPGFPALVAGETRGAWVKHGSEAFEEGQRGSGGR